MLIQIEICLYKIDLKMNFCLLKRNKKFLNRLNSNIKSYNKYSTSMVQSLI